MYRECQTQTRRLDNSHMGQRRCGSQGDGTDIRNHHTPGNTMITRLGFLKTLLTGAIAMPFGEAVGEGFVNPSRATPWRPIPLATGWTAISGFTASFRKNANGNLELAGQITSTVGTPANSFNVFSTKLPAGFFNPTVEKFALCILSDINGGPTAIAAIVGMFIGAGLDGELQYASSLSNTAGQPINLVLDGCIIPITSP